MNYYPPKKILKELSKQKKQTKSYVTDEVTPS